MPARKTKGNKEVNVCAGVWMQNCPYFCRCNSCNVASFSRKEVYTIEFVFNAQYALSIKCKIVFKQDHYSESMCIVQLLLSYYNEARKERFVIVIDEKQRKMNFFTQIQNKIEPLAQRMRPKTLDEFIGQEHIVGEGRLLRRAITMDQLSSSIFFGPPGCGKTTLASIIANNGDAVFEKLNAVSAGVKDLRAVIDDAENRQKMYGIQTYLLLDECHRWSKAQSDCILPALEEGTIKFIGSTTENPMVAMTSAIVSRCRLFQFHPLSLENVETALQRALADKARGFGDYTVQMNDDALRHLARTANGDIRTALNALELAIMTTEPDTNEVIHVTLNIATESIQQKQIVCGEDQYYDMLSAFCKSLRGSDSDAALAWFSRLIYAGVDPRILARRMIAHASEDIGLANPQAMQQAVAAMQALEMIGMPEARLPLAQAIIYLCEASKSNAVVIAIDRAMQDAKQDIDAPVPAHLRDTNYKTDEQKKVKYNYPHDYAGHYIEQQYMPLHAQGHIYYEPSDQGQEARIQEIHKHRKKWKPKG